jgi:hypothetical protein
MIPRPHHAVRNHAVILAAVFALLGQVLFPHVHAWHERRGPAASDPAVAPCTAECATALVAVATDVGGDTDQHASGCPLCRAQNDARSSLLPPSFAVLLPAATPALLTADAATTSAAFVRSLVAPRAPPLAS